MTSDLGTRDPSRAYYDVVFERDFHKKRGSEFQNLFCEIMELRYPSDFVRVRPWGREGDRKNDGYLRSKRVIFQVYAPNDMDAATAIKKIDEDFHECLPYWAEHFDCWSFVHNSREGLSPPITKKLLELDGESTDVAVGHFGFAELWTEVSALGIAELEMVFGPAPSQRAMLSVGFDEIQVVTGTIAHAQPTDDSDMRPVPARKLAANALSEDVAALLRLGMTRANLVEDFFQRWHDPLLGDRVAMAFRAEYVRLREAGMGPDEIFADLQAFAGGGMRGTPRHEAAVLAVIAHLFEQCDIFERPAEGT